MLVIQTANGNVYPAETCVWRTEQVSTGGYRLTHFDIHSPNISTSGTGTAAPERTVCQAMLAPFFPSL